MLCRAIILEESLAKLNELVTQMESGDLSLSEALTAFEKGIQITRRASEILDETSQRVQVLMEGRAEDASTEWPSEGEDG